MYFRPFPLLTAFSIPALVALLWLGVWQGQRAQWKADEVAGFAQKLAAPATPLADICARGLAEQQILGTPSAAGPAVRVFGTRASGKAGWKLYQVSDICGVPVLVQTGFEELAIGGPGGVSPAPPPIVRCRFRNPMRDPGDRPARRGSRRAHPDMQAE